MATKITPKKTNPTTYKRGGEKKTPKNF